jgi:multiple sugar transport system substrate-binding protein
VLRRAALCAFLVAAFSQLGGTQDQPIRLSLVAWEHESGPDLRKCSRMLEDFARSHPHIKIDMSHDKWTNAHARMTRWFGSQRVHAPDLTVMPDAWVDEFAEHLSRFSPSFTRYLDAFVPVVVAPIRRSGGICGVPWRMDSYALYYRRDLLPVGNKPPTNWEELLATASEMTDVESNTFGLGFPGAIGGGGARALLILLAGAGGSVYDTNGEVEFESPEMLAALEYLVSLVQAGALQPEILSWDAGELEGAFADGKIAMVMAGSTLAERLTRERPDLDFAVTPLPGGKKPVASISASYVVALQTTQHREACMEFLKFMTSASAQHWMLQTGSVPSHRGVIAQAQADPLMRVFSASLDEVLTHPTRDRQMMEAMLEDLLFLVLGGRCSPGQAVELVQTHYTDTSQPRPPQ